MTKVHFWKGEVGFGCDGYKTFKKPRSMNDIFQKRCRFEELSQNYRFLSFNFEILKFFRAKLTKFEDRNALLVFVCSESARVFFLCSCSPSVIANPGLTKTT